ncbi:PIN domain-containing protein [Halomonas pacifica]|uniref:PIN domain-containing protein n=1 Tax=Bisbaumannia pacifica TaxID=77098 RepID=UPI002359073B|nr:PIN domain-containing protein [Halomonas pacifica]MDC8802542.1 PIN domain-containing protein [Halomonas pacifica]
MPVYTAVLIDTNIFIETKFNFDGGSLERLKSFRGRPENIIYDDVIYNEVVSHFSDLLLKSSNGLRRSFKEARRSKLLGADDCVPFDDLFVDEAGAVERAKDKFDRYLEECDALYLSTHENSDLERVLNDYFNLQPPFEFKESKKHEFPDAFCLTAVLSWAKRTDNNVLLVSSDKGWRDFCYQNSESLSIVENIADALDALQEFGVRSYYLGLFRGHWSTIEQSVSSCLQDVFHDQIVNGFVEIDATSYLHYDAEVEDVVIDEIAYDVDQNGDLCLSLIEIPDEGVNGDFVVSLSADVSYTVEASFGFSVRDSVDKDMMFLGGTVERVKNRDDIEIDVRLGTFGGMVYFVSADVQNVPSAVHFGDVEPDFSD